MNDDFRQLLLATAASVGVSPIDLATAISYETAGTFNPMKRGPTTKWGQHRGLIQFGEPQARQFGVDWNDPLNSQLGPNGAVAKYLKASGFKPGMSGLDLYSTINAGAPGLYNASDTAAGGAPGDVRDKWENQMGGHRQKAMALLQGNLSPEAMEFVRDNPQPDNYAGLETGKSVFGSMAPQVGGPPPGAGEWAFSDDKGGFGDRLAKAGAAIDNAVMPPARISGGGGDARQSGNALLKLLMGNPSALAQSLLSRRLA